MLWDLPSQLLQVSTFITSPIIQIADRGRNCEDGTGSKMHTRRKSGYPYPLCSRASVPLTTYYTPPPPSGTPCHTGNCETSCTSKLRLKSQKLCASILERGIINRNPAPQEEKVLTTPVEHKFFAGPRRAIEFSKFSETFEIISFKADS